MTHKYELLTGEVIEAVPPSQHGNFVDLTEEAFEHLTVVAYAGKKRKNDQQPSPSTMSMWICECDCGSFNTYSNGNLRSGKSTHCRRCSTKYRKPGKSGGLSKTKLYYRWYRLNFHHPKEVCARWKRSVLDFVSDVGEPPENTFLARIDDSRKYGPDNFQWIDRQKVIAKTIGVWYTLGKKSGCMADWARWLGISRERVRQRLKKYPPEIALSENFEAKSEQYRKSRKKIQ